MDLLTKELEAQIHQKVIESFICGNFEKAVKNIYRVLGGMYANIPEKKRLPYGRYTTIKVLAETLFNELKIAHLSVVKIGATILNSTQDHRTIGVGLGFLAFYGLEDRIIHFRYYDICSKNRNLTPGHPFEII